MANYREECGYSVYGCCLMPNHVHLVLRMGRQPLETIMRRIGAGFVYWHNAKYARTGHLFQDRYRSEPVESDGNLLAAIRYVHWNPVKAGLCSAPEAYPRSSYARYFERQGLIDSAVIAGMSEHREPSPCVPEAVMPHGTKTGPPGKGSCLRGICGLEIRCGFNQLKQCLELVNVLHPRLWTSPKRVSRASPSDMSWRRLAQRKCL